MVFILLEELRANDLIIYDTELSEYIMRKSNVLKMQLTSPLFTDDVRTEMYQKLKTAYTTDQKIRESHV